MSSFKCSIIVLIACAISVRAKQMSMDNKMNEKRGIIDNIGYSINNKGDDLNGHGDSFTNINNNNNVYGIVKENVASDLNAKFTANIALNNLENGKEFSNGLNGNNFDNNNNNKYYGTELATENNFKFQLNDGKLATELTEGNFKTNAENFATYQGNYALTGDNLQLGQDNHALIGQNLGLTGGNLGFNQGLNGGNLDVNVNGGGATVTTINRAVPVFVPQPVAVTINRAVPVPIPQAVPVNVPRPVAVTIPVPRPVAIPRPVPVTVTRPVPVYVPQQIPVPVAQPVGVPVPQPYPVTIPQAVPVRVPQTVIVPVVQPIYVSGGAGNDGFQSGLQNGVQGGFQSGLQGVYQGGFQGGFHGGFQHADVNGLTVGVADSLKGTGYGHNLVSFGNDNKYGESLVSVENAASFGNGNKYGASLVNEENASNLYKYNDYKPNNLDLGYKNMGNLAISHTNIESDNKGYTTSTYGQGATSYSSIKFGSKY